MLAEVIGIVHGEYPDGDIYTKASLNITTVLL